MAKIGGSVQSAIADRTLKIQQAIARQNTGKDYLNVALSILEQKDFPENLKKNQGLRKWAVDLLKNYSDVPIDDTTAAELVSGETRLPKVVDAGRVVATERMEAAAKDEITATLAASADGLLNAQVTIAGNLCVFNRDGLMVRAFPDGLPYLKGAAFSPDDRYLVTYDSGHLAVVTLTGNLSIATPVHLGGIQSVAFSGNNVIVVTDHNGRRRSMM